MKQENMVTVDGRVAPLWEHYAGYSFPVFAILRGFHHFGLMPALWTYAVFIVMAIPAYYLWQIDKEANDGLARRDNIDQTVPLRTKIYTALYAALLVVFVWQDYARYQQHEHALQEQALMEGGNLV